MIDYDVVIVGAGPAGSTAAKILSEKGINSLLIDKEKFPREKPCGGGLPLWVLKRFPHLFNSNYIESYSYGGIIYSNTSKYKVEVHKNYPSIAMVLRKKFDNELVNAAIKNGVKFLDGVKVIDIKFENNYTILILSDNTSIKTSIVIGADGFNSIIARKTGLFTKRRFTGVSVVEEFQLSEKILDKFYTKNRFCHIHLKIFGITGYGWVFPKKNHLNIGLGDVRLKSNRNQQNLKMIFNKYLEILKKQEIIPKNIKSIKLRGGSLPVWPHEKTYMNNVLLCGDAAGFINPVTGEGIYYALKSAEIAANITIKALKAENTSERFLSQYEKEWKKDFGKDIKYMLNSTKKIRNENEKFIQTMSKDKKLAEMLFDIMTGQQSIYKLRWKLIRRYVYSSSRISLCNLIKFKK